MKVLVELHPCLKDNPGFDHLFKVGDGHPEEANVGRYICFKGSLRRFPYYQQIFIIGALQFNYKGDLCYRAYGVDGDTFGCVADPDEIVFLDQGGSNEPEPV